MSPSILFVLFYGLIASSPILLLFPSLIADGIVLVVVACCIAIFVETSSAKEQSRLPTLIGPIYLVGLAATLFVLILQVVPMPGGPLINPIWQSAAMAIGEEPSGSVTVDIGATFLVICRLCCFVAITLLATLLGQHRHAAELLLSTLAGTAALVSLERIADRILPPGLLPVVSPAAAASGQIISVLGFVIAAAAIVQAYEKSPPAELRSRQRRPTARIAAAGAALLINLIAIVYIGPNALLFAALFGAGLLLAVLVIRKGAFDYWGQAGAGALLALALASFIAFMPSRADNDLITRMMDDARSLGIGAGTLAGLAPVYGGSTRDRNVRHRSDGDDRNRNGETISLGDRADRGHMGCPFDEGLPATAAGLCLLGRRRGLYSRVVAFSAIGRRQPVARPMHHSGRHIRTCIGAEQRRGGLSVRGFQRGAIHHGPAPPVLATTRCAAGLCAGSDRAGRLDSIA
ncbi:hypothetical protein [Rhodopseudomonas sp. B29]|uniref:hypothetical protein n=1 Tax=Rhodopseudomonas sp. B29 TaxID=95607 RepID=UPI00034BCF3A|nr:hypothetical protein [Rhodopseudomonas sp. B29]